MTDRVGDGDGDGDGDGSGTGTRVDFTSPSARRVGGAGRETRRTRRL